MMKAVVGERIDFIICRGRMQFGVGLVRSTAYQIPTATLCFSLGTPAVDNLLILAIAIALFASLVWLRRGWGVSAAAAESSWSWAQRIVSAMKMSTRCGWNGRFWYISTWESVEAHWIHYHYRRWEGQTEQEVDGQFHGKMAGKRSPRGRRQQ